ncbi:glycosyltransferase [Devosia sp. ZB163]|uniref:glycosyltransferase n=1 Tax=Devosia sp. ZB163 TaxID=3025938 RepID=UPI002361DF9B|nr:glycosyltransferase [Devosia sp. ZB163]MDC9825774.1 glycosyltransferase [Devosia sp. ZB163]
MKVLHVEPGKGLAGGGQQVLYIVEGLRSRGVEGVVACEPDGPLDTQLRAMGIRTAPTIYSGDADLFYAARLRDLAAREGADLVHLHSRRGAVLGMIAAKWAGVPCVTSRRVDDRLSSPVSVWAHSRLNARVVCISDAIRRVMQNAGVPADKLVTIRSSVDPAPWQHPAPRPEFLAEFALPDDAFVIGVVAQLIPRKGHRYLFEALSELASERVRVVVFGNGRSQAELEQMVAQLGLGAVVQFAGQRWDLPRWMGNLDLLVHPATMEGLGVALLQASSAGVPIVASAAGGIIEAVRHGVNGLLVPPADVPALREAIALLLADESRGVEMGRAGMALMASEYSAGAMVEQHIALYQGILANRN